MKEILFNVIHSRDTRIGRFFDLFIQSLILIAILAHSLETMPSFKKFHDIFKIIDNAFLIIFSTEYVLRVYSARQRLKFIFSFYGMIDLLAILPGIIFLTKVDLSFLRAFRLIRLFRAFKLLRYSKAVERLGAAFSSIKEELLIFGCFSMILLYVSAAGVYYFESTIQPDKFTSIPESLWWAVCTLTTVGYGDVYPITAGGKIFTSIILFIGLGIIAVPSGLFASAFNTKK